MPQSSAMRRSRNANPAAVERIGALDRAAVRRHVEARFSVDRMVDEYLRVYEEVLRDHRSQATGRSTTLAPMRRRFHGRVSRRASEANMEPPARNDPRRAADHKS